MQNDNTILILGSGGQLAREFQKVLKEKKITYVAPPEKELDITDEKQSHDAIHRIRPNVIINCAAYNLVDEAEDQEKLAFKINSESVKNLARLCQKRNIFFIHYSSDYVFDGRKKEIYCEDDNPNPINVYGHSKFKGEEAVKKHLNDFLIFRLSWVFGEGRQNFLFKLSQWAKRQRIINVACDEVSTPTYTEDVVRVTLLSIEKGLRGLFHLTNSGYCSRFDLAKFYFEKSGLNNTLTPVLVESFPLKAKRPLFTAMSNKKISKALGLRIPTWQDAVDRFVVRCKSNVSLK